jgi:hypothetical protein
MTSRLCGDRRPAWEDDCKLKTQNIVFMNSLSGDRE